MSFRSIKKIKRCRQINPAPPEEVFPLLCPVREADWLKDWNYRMIYSKSGFAERGCVFATPHHSGEETIWGVTDYDPQNFYIAFSRWTPGEMVVLIRIQLTGINNGSTSADIEYEYTSLNQSASKFLNNKIDTEFKGMMAYWEKAINHYLETGEMYIP